MPAMHIGMPFKPWVPTRRIHSTVLRPFRPGTLSRHDEAAMQDFGSESLTTLTRLRMDILEINDMWRVLKFTLLVRIAMRPKPLMPTSWLALTAVRASCSHKSPATVFQCLKTHGSMDLI
ncbi:hypothetical protein TNCV_855781 [Trichonephila clavipes]|nr:hypothetical protein TNCV_855781 [Trichonephila clavipes]